MMFKLNFAGKTESDHIRFEFNLRLPIRGTYNACALHLTHSNDTASELHKTATGKNRFLTGFEGDI